MTMKTTIKILEIVFLIFIFEGCKTEEISLNMLDEFPTTKYYSTDIIPEQYNHIYGIWKVTKTSGGFIGIGYEKDFDYLILKKNGIFGIIRKDSLITYGKLTLLPDLDMNFPIGIHCKFDFEKSVNIELCSDSEKYIQLINNDTLNLIAPCCDRYNIHFIRQK